MIGRLGQRSLRSPWLCHDVQFIKSDVTLWNDAIAVDVPLMYMYCLCRAVAATRQSEHTSITTETYVALDLRLIHWLAPPFNEEDNAA